MHKEIKYSKTWLKRANTINKSIKDVSVDNFYLYSSFTGFYENPSPFIYSKNSIAAHINTPIFFDFHRNLRIVRNLFNYYKRYLELKRDDYFNKVGEFLPYIKDSGASNKIFEPFYSNFKQRKMNGTFLKCSEQAFNIDSAIPTDNLSIICEIGGGFGAMAEVMIKKYNPNFYIIIDLPETLEVSKMYLNHVFPGRVHYFNETNISKILIKEDLNVILVDFNKYTHIKKYFPSINLFINSNSFGEMEIEMVKEYFIFIESYSNVYLSNTNRNNRKEGGYLYNKKSYPYLDDWIEKYSNYQKIEEYKNNHQMITYLP